MFAEDTTVVVISGSKDSLCKIIKSSVGTFKLFGYHSFEI